jgi:YidC/Oxa1 family membrane protein insertase
LLARIRRVTFRLSSRQLLMALLLVAVVVVLAACVPAPSPAASGASGSPTLTPTPPAAIPLHPASPGANPLDLLAWLFTPVFQILFVTLVLIDQKLVGGNIAIAIVIVTLIIRVLLIPLYRRQLESQRRMQVLAPELKELRRRHKDRTERMAAEQDFYKSRGINPAGGCLPLVLQFILLIPMYSVFSAGLTNTNPNAMLNVFGLQLIQLNCPAAPIIEAGGHVKPCLDTIVFGVDWSRPEILLSVAGFGISALAIVSSLMQLVQSRMTLPPADPNNDDPNARIQRQTLLFVPLISILYGGILPAGLFLYWIGSTIFTIAQQYLIIGWGSLFPIFGWYPEFARNHTPRFPVRIPDPKPSTDPKTGAARPRTEDRKAAADRTIQKRGRQGRRGRRR